MILSTLDSIEACCNMTVDASWLEEGKEGGDEGARPLLLYK